MRTFLSLTFALALSCFCSETFAQCRSSGGQAGSGGRQMSQRGGQGFSPVASSQRSSQSDRAMTGQVSYFHQQMLQSQQRQLMQRQQAAIATAKQAKRNLRKGKQLDTRRSQRAAELARREVKKREAADRQNQLRANQVRLASSLR